MSEISNNDVKNVVVEMKDICKEFSGVKVLKKARLNIYEGKVMALLGENGAGKSTLIKILTGVYTRTSGEVFLRGEAVKFNDIKASQKAGIAIIHQELNLLQHLSIAENIFLGREPLTSIKTVNWKKLYGDAEYWLEKLGLNFSPRTLISELSVGQQQLVEIAKALSLDANIIVMDEPTGALTLQETERLYEVIRDLKAHNCSIVYISHRLNEIFEVCDDVTVLRDGEFVGEVPITDLDEDKMIEMMVGRKLEDQYPRLEVPIGDTVLEVKNLTNEHIKNVNFELKKGQILGVAGLMGSGRTELMRTLYGIYPVKSGEILLDGSAVKITDPKKALSEGIAYVSEDRKANGIVLGLSVAENTVIATLREFLTPMKRVSKNKTQEAVDNYIKDLSIKTSSPDQLLRNLSGGNQQKVAIAKCLITKPKILILDEPTRGVDVGAKKEIYDVINKLKGEGMSILMVSSEMGEVLGMSDEILVMHEGKMTGKLPRVGTTQEDVMALAVGKEVC